MDKGYDFQEVRDLVAEFGLTAQILSRGNEAKALRRHIGYRARRWVVERSHSWINRCRGLLVRWAKKARNYLAFLHLACGIITWLASGLLG
jgi:putative transposase